MAKIPAVAQPFHAVTGAPAPPEWAGYWTFVTATILIAFVLFLAGKTGSDGKPELGKWLALFNLGAIKPLALSGAGAPSATNPPGQIMNPTGTDLGGGITIPSWVPFVGGTKIPGLVIGVTPPAAFGPSSPPAGSPVQGGT